MQYNNIVMKNYMCKPVSQLFIGYLVDLDLTDFTCSVCSLCGAQELSAV